MPKSRQPDKWVAMYRVRYLDEHGKRRKRYVFLKQSMAARRWKTHWRCMVKRFVPEPTGVASGLLPQDGWLITNCPRVVEFLTDTKYDDGSCRQTATLSVFIEEGLLKIALNDRDSLRSLYRAGPTLQDALLSIEKACLDPNADWRLWRKPKTKK